MFVLFIEGLCYTWINIEIGKFSIAANAVGRGDLQEKGPFAQDAGGPFATHIVVMLRHCSIQYKGLIKWDP